MASSADVFGVLNDMKTAGVIEDYALDGAMAMLFYAEPARTYDLDVFVRLPGPHGTLVVLTPVYQ